MHSYHRQRATTALKRQQGTTQLQDTHAYFRQRTSLNKRRSCRQLSTLHLHAIKYLLFTLWEEGMSEDDREKVKVAIKEALFTLVNSTKKHLKDKDTSSLQERIDKTLKVIDEMAKTLEEDGHIKAAALRKNRLGCSILTAGQLRLPLLTFFSRYHIGLIKSAYSDSESALQLLIDQIRHS